MRLPIVVAGCALALAAAFGMRPAAGEPGTARESETAPEEIRWPSSVGEVVFPHLMHVEDVGAACDTCHHETLAPELEVPHPDYFDDFWVDCATCHAAPPGSPGAVSAHRCASCHPEKTASGPRVEMPTVKVAIHRSCWSCHDEGRGAEASATCGSCHHRETPAAGAASHASR